MTFRDEQITQEARALWRAIHGADPPAVADGPALLDAVLGSLPAADYHRINSVHLRPATITGPART